MKVIIAGSTGMVGKGVLLESLKDDRIAEVLVINRASLNMNHPKLKEIIHKDFLNLSSIEHQLSGYNACYFCLGISSFRMSESDYTRITYDLTMHFAETLKRQSPGLVFCFISGAGTDGTEKGRSMWARVKGKAENGVLGMGFKDAYALRPAFIQPVGDIKSRTPMYNTLIGVIKPLFPLLNKFPQFVTATDKLGQAMINVSINGYKKKVMESADINQMA